MSNSRHRSGLDRDEIVRRGLDFIYHSACDSENFQAYGFDYLFCLHWIYSTSEDKRLRSAAFKMGKERARYWRQQNPALPSDIDADTITHFVFANGAADRLGVRDSALKKQISRAAGDFTARDYFWFDPKVEPPPVDVPQTCECGWGNPRGRKVCRKCKARLGMMSHYEVWLVALIRTYMGERDGITLGAPYKEALKWLPRMRPYCGIEGGYDYHFGWTIYAITHVVYTLNHYGKYKLLPGWLPEEFAFLKRNIKEAIAMDDPETVGEFLDCLKSFGLTARNSVIREGEAYLMSCQNPDGSWGDPDAEDAYERYHPTLTAINGLRKYAWAGVGLSFSGVRGMLEKWASAEA